MLASPSRLHFLFPSFRSQRAYYFRFFFSEEGRDVFVGGYSGSSILATLLPASPLNAPLYPPSTTPFAGSKDLVEGESAVTRVSRPSFLFSFLSFVSLHPRRDTFTYILRISHARWSLFLRESSSRTRTALNSSPYPPPPVTVLRECACITHRCCNPCNLHDHRRQYFHLFLISVEKHGAKTSRDF